MYINYNLYTNQNLFPEQLDVRRAEARKREKMARENMRKIQRANDSFFSSVRLIHSQQLDQIDSAIHHAQQGRSLFNIR